MTKQIKIFFTFLAVAAVFSVISFFDIFKGAKSGNLHGEIVPLAIDLNNDTDHDGLSDNEEAYWNTDFQNPDTDGDGFLDGEEVASGRDPREPAGDDSIADTVYGTVQPVPIEDLDLSDLNISNNMTDLLAGGIATGDLTRDADPDKKSETIDSLSLLAMDSFSQTQLSYQPPPLVIVDNSTENQTDYLNTLAEIIKEDLLDFPQKLNIAAPLTGQSDFFNIKSRQFESSLDKVLKLAVPAEWAEIHKSILNLLHRLSINYSFVASYETDPLKATLALNELSAIDLETKSLLQIIQIKISDNKLTLANNVYQILDLLFKN